MYQSSQPHLYKQQSSNFITQLGYHSVKNSKVSASPFFTKEDVYRNHNKSQFLSIYNFTGIAAFGVSFNNVFDILFFRVPFSKKQKSQEYLRFMARAYLLVELNYQKQKKQYRSNRKYVKFSSRDDYCFDELFIGYKQSDQTNEQVYYAQIKLKYKDLFSKIRKYAKHKLSQHQCYEQESSFDENQFQEFDFQRIVEKMFSQDSSINSELIKNVANNYRFHFRTILQNQIIFQNIGTKISRQEKFVNRIHLLQSKSILKQKGKKQEDNKSSHKLKYKSLNVISEQIEILFRNDSNYDSPQKSKPELNKDNDQQRPLHLNSINLIMSKEGSCESSDEFNLQNILNQRFYEKQEGDLDNNTGNEEFNYNNFPQDTVQQLARLVLKQLSQQSIFNLKVSPKLFIFNNLKQQLIKKQFSFFQYNFDQILNQLFDFNNFPLSLEQKLIYSTPRLDIDIYEELSTVLKDSSSQLLMKQKQKQLNILRLCILLREMSTSRRIFLKKQNQQYNYLNNNDIIELRSILKQLLISTKILSHKKAETTVHEETIEQLRQDYEKRLNQFKDILFKQKNNQSKNQKK